MIKCILIDDEPKNNRILRKMLEDYCPMVSVVAEAENAESGINMIRQHEPELVFLDIEMPYGSGFSMLDKFGVIPFHIIFVTAFAEYSLKAFKYSAVDYLLKPVNIGELKAAVQKAEERIRSSQLQRQLDSLFRNLRPRSGLDKIALPSKEGLTFILIDDIIHCEANGSYTIFYLQNGEKIVSTKNLKEYEEILPQNLFFRVHHSHIINLNCIKKYHRGRGGYLEMIDGSSIEVATRRKEEFLSRFNL